SVIKARASVANRIVSNSSTCESDRGPSGEFSWAWRLTIGGNPLPCLDRNGLGLPGADPFSRAPQPSPRSGAAAAFVEYRMRLMKLKGVPGWAKYALIVPAL